jgi:hypothetical protein
LKGNFLPNMAFEDVDLTDFWNPVICERVTGLTLSIKFQSLAEQHSTTGIWRTRGEKKAVIERN